jgi:hypothetical protein
MEGALPSVVAGLVSAPVIAVPTSVGYGASFHGLAPLLAMLNACAAGVAVVNIDNGFGAGYLAAVINKQAWETPKTEGRTTLKILLALLAMLLLVPLAAACGGDDDDGGDDGASTGDPFHRVLATMVLKISDVPPGMQSLGTSYSTNEQAASGLGSGPTKEQLDAWAASSAIPDFQATDPATGQHHRRQHCRQHLQGRRGRL